MIWTSWWELTRRPARLKHCGTRLTTVTDVHHIIISISCPILPSSSILRHSRADRGCREITSGWPRTVRPLHGGQGWGSRSRRTCPASFPTSSLTLAPWFLPTMACCSAEPQPFDPALLHITSVIPISPGSKRADLLYIYWVGLMCSHSLGWQRD